MRFERSMAIGSPGYCLVPGHDVYHTLEQQCWGRLRAWLLESKVITEKQYIADCNRK